MAGAGGAAHLAGVAAAHTTLPVLGVPMESASLKGLDSLLATVQMPGRHPRRDLRDRQARRGQRRALRRRDPRRQAARSSSKKLEDFRAEQAAKILKETLP